MSQARFMSNKIQHSFENSIHEIENNYVRVLIAQVNFIKLYKHKLTSETIYKLTSEDHHTIAAFKSKSGPLRRMTKIEMNEE